MFHSPPLSPRRSLVDRHSIVSGRATPSQPRYYRDQYGKLKYAIEVDLVGFPEENIHVTNVRNIIAIDAKFIDTDASGDERTHELRRELYLPPNVNPNTVTCVLSADGILVLEADALEQKQRPLSPPNSAHMNRITTASYLASPTRFTSPPPPVLPNFDRSNFREMNSHEPRQKTVCETESAATLSSKNRSSINQINDQNSIFDKSQVPNTGSFVKPATESILKSSSNRRPVKNVRLVAPPTVNQTSNSSHLKNNWKRASSATSELSTRQNLHFPHGNAAKSTKSNSLHSSKRYSLRVDVGPQIRPEDLSVSVQNGVIVVHAKRFMDNANACYKSKESNRIVYEHRSEHTLPVHVNPIDLLCRLNNGVVTIEAPVSTGCTHTSMSSPVTKCFPSNQSNSVTQKRQMNTSKSLPFSLYRASSNWPWNHI
ncbi:hypothetical protein FBUS_08221 [Fasciolopsis buskii]|uniref:SHSP domain-containing protein n=1 Tax=Fasciolopsis buskii TaxID=27845 RepID=A0A8E0S7V0_9TREM|nr:hypothetical protein FBUS_08221 [Fasciolopsis buski]